MLFEMPVVPQLVKKFPAFYANLGFVTLFTKPTSSPYSEADKASAHPPILFPDPVQYYPFMYSKQLLSLRFYNQKLV